MEREGITAELLAAKLATVDAKFDLIHEVLMRIEKQTTKTNGSVADAHRKIAELEKNTPHSVVTCPQALVISKLNQEYIERQAVRKSYVKTAGIIGGLAGAIGSILVALIEWLKDII